MFPRLRILAAASRSPQGRRHSPTFYRLHVISVEERNVQRGSNAESLRGVDAPRSMRLRPAEVLLPGASKRQRLEGCGGGKLQRPSMFPRVSSSASVGTELWSPAAALFD